MVAGRFNARSVAPSKIPRRGATIEIHAWSKTKSHGFKRRAATRIDPNDPVRGMNPTATIMPSRPRRRYLNHPCGFGEAETEYVSTCASIRANGQTLSQWKRMRVISMDGVTIIGDQFSAPTTRKNLCASPMGMVALWRS